MLATKLLSRLNGSSVRGVAAMQRFEHTLPALPYASNALEPVISQEIMELHHGKHHKTYVNQSEQCREATERMPG